MVKVKKNKFGKELAKICIDRDIDMKDCSSMSGISYPALLAACTKDSPTVNMVDKIANGLGLSDTKRKMLCRLSKDVHTQSLSIGRVKMYGLSDSKRNAIIDLCHLLRDADEAQIRKMVKDLSGE